MNRSKILSILFFCLIHIMAQAWSLQNLVQKTAVSDSKDKNEKSLIAYIIEQEKKIISLQNLCADYNRNPYFYDRYLLNSFKKLEQVIEETKKQIAQFIDSGVDINVKDSLGHTALDYCTTEFCYNLLREKGARFQLNAWIYRNNGTVLCAGISTGFLTALGAVILSNR